MNEKQNKTMATPDIEQIAEMAEQGQDVSAYFTGQHLAKRRVEVDFPLQLLQALTPNVCRSALPDKRGSRGRAMNICTNFRRKGLMLSAPQRAAPDWSRLPQRLHSQEGLGKMSAEYSVVYYGLKFPVSNEEVTTLKNDAHPHQLIARQFGLDCDWGDCWIEGNDYVVFVGKELSRIGAEHEWNQELNDTELRQIMERTQALLRAAGFTDEPKLRLHFVPDI